MSMYIYIYCWDTVAIVVLGDFVLDVHPNLLHKPGFLKHSNQPKSRYTVRNIHGGVTSHKTMNANRRGGLILCDQLPILV